MRVCVCVCVCCLCVCVCVTVCCLRVYVCVCARMGVGYKLAAHLCRLRTTRCFLSFNECARETASLHLPGCSQQSQTLNISTTKMQTMSRQVVADLFHKQNTIFVSACRVKFEGPVRENQSASGGSSAAVPRAKCVISTDRSSLRGMSDRTLCSARIHAEFIVFGR